MSNHKILYQIGKHYQLYVELKVCCHFHEDTGHGRYRDNQYLARLVPIYILYSTDLFVRLIVGGAEREVEGVVNGSLPSWVIREINKVKETRHGGPPITSDQCYIIR